MSSANKIDDLLAPHGLVRLGIAPNDDPGLPDGQILLVGNAGPAMWRAFSASSEHSDNLPHSLNRWTKRVLSGVAEDLDVSIKFPFDGPPYFPFQRWMKATGTAYQSPIGMLIHARYGLWFAMRGALFVDVTTMEGSPSSPPSPCDSCAGKPCLTTCPVDAFGADGYDVPVCKAHLLTRQGEDCMSQGCRARRACPIGMDYHYGVAQARLHMTAFRG